MTTTNKATHTFQPISDGWEMEAIRRVHLLHSQLDAAIALAQKSDLIELKSIDFMGDHSPYMQKLAAFYRENLPLARLLDRSDIMFHAHGPAAGGGSPKLIALNWLSNISEKAMNSIGRAWLDIRGQDGRKLTKKMDFRLTGMAPGSLWMGFAINPTATADLLPQDTEIVDGVRESIQSLVGAGAYIGEEGLMPGLSERIENPAERDMILDALYLLSPNGRCGIHTLGLQTKSDSTSLTNAHRTVLREILNTPQDPLKAGVFTGEVRAVDMDKSRMHLHTSSTGVLRCVMQINKHEAKKMIGEHVRVTGRYAVNKAGAPSLLYVDKIDPLPTQVQKLLD